jgi:hypothetical protein
VVTLVVLWGFGLASAYTLGGLIHVLLIVAIIAIVARADHGTPRRLTKRRLSGRGGAAATLAAERPPRLDGTRDAFTSAWRSSMHRFTLLLAAVATAALAAGCFGTAGYSATVSSEAYRPDLVYAAPGVQVIADYDEPIGRPRRMTISTTATRSGDER